MRGQISQEYEGISRRILKRKLLDALAASHDFEVPPSLVDAEFEAIWKQFEEAKARGEPDPADADRDEEEIKAEYRLISVRRVRLGLLLAHVGEANNIVVQQDEVNRAVAEQARRFPEQERKIIEYYQSDPQALAQIKAPLFEEKVVDFICEMADVSEREVSSQELMQGEDAEAGEGATEAADGNAKKSQKKKPKAVRAKRKQARKPPQSEG
jgi:trigger factor